MASTRVRSAAVEDAKAVAELSTQLGYPATEAQSQQRLGELLDAPDQHGVLVAEVGGRVVGWIHVCARHCLENDAFAELAGLIVAEGHRSEGIGGQLLMAAEQWAGQRQLARLRVRSNVKRARAHGFYVERGYACLKEQAVFEKSLVPVADRGGLDSQ